MSNENLTTVNTIQDQLLEAMQIVSSQLISSIPYDKTVLCTIENDTNKDKGEYTVTDGEISFMAYSSDTTFKTGYQVFVTIPEGKYENQKIIVGKKTSNNDQPFVFISPFDTMLDLTTNVVDVHGEKNFPASLTANDNTTESNKICINGIQYTTIFSASGLAEYSGYTRLGIKADFQSWLPNAVTGQYGLKITIVDQQKTVTNEQGSTDNQSRTSYYLFDSSEMYGNPYNFETNYTQEKVLMIEGLNTITDIKVEFYQQVDSFKRLKNTQEETEIDTIIPYYEETEDIENPENKIKTVLPPNLFVDNLYICFGYSTNEITDEYIKLVTNDSLTYSNLRNDTENAKDIELRWVHQTENGPIVVLGKEDKRVSEPWQVKWYRYRLGAQAADEYCGVYWELIENATELKYTFIPNIDFQSELIKAIIFIGENVVVRSSPINFDNETIVKNQAVLDFINALDIECLDNTFGNYLIYNETGNLLNQADTQIERKLRCNFAVTGTVAKSELELFLEKDDSITWKIPLKNSMIKLLGYERDPSDQTIKYYIPNYYKNKEGAEQKKYLVTKNPSSLVYTDEKENYLIIQGEAACENINDLTYIHYPAYKINGYYSAYTNNNTIACTIQKDRIVYNAEKEFTFGTAGTMGTDETIVIDFVGGHTAIAQGDSGAYQLQVKMYDANNQEKDLTQIQDKIKWYWYEPTADSSTPKFSFVNSTSKSLYYNPKDPTKPNIITGNVVELKQNGLAMGDLYIAMVVVGDNELITYFPIPIKTNKNGIVPSHIEGATQVVYLSDGTPDYYKGDYQLYHIVTDPTTTEELVEQITPSKVKWKIIGGSKGTDAFTAKFGGFSNALAPVDVYVEKANMYGVQCTTTSGNVLWTQPILVIRNKYPSRVINKWDGKSLTIDNDTGIILNTALAAGSKDSQGKFTGVMLGDWTRSVADASITGTTGIFGFHGGEMAFAFKDNGTAFIGKDGKGRIELNGNDATIHSSDWDESDKTGMCIDLNGSVGSTTSAPFIKMYKDSNKKIILDTGETDTGYPFQIGTQFKSKWDGSVTMSNANVIGTITAGKGKIGSWTIEEMTYNYDTKTYTGTGSLYSGSSATDTTGIILNPSNHSVTGGTFYASTLEALTGTIKLGGYVSVFPIEKDATTGKNKINYSTTGGTLGFLAADFGGDIESTNSETSTNTKNAGIGLDYNGISCVKATARNAGLSCAGYYLSLQNADSNIQGDVSRAVLRSTSSGGGRLVLDPSHLGIGFGDTFISLTSDVQVGSVLNGSIHIGLEGCVQAGSLKTLGFTNTTQNTSNIETSLEAWGKVTIGKKTIVTKNGTTLVSNTEEVNDMLTVYGETEITGNLQVNSKNTNRNPALKVNYTTGESNIARLAIGSTLFTDGDDASYVLKVSNWMYAGGGLYTPSVSLTSSLTVGAGGTVSFNCGSSNQHGIYARFA